MTKSCKYCDNRISVKAIICRDCFHNGVGLDQQPTKQREEITMYPELTTDDKEYAETLLNDSDVKALAMTVLNHEAIEECDMEFAIGVQNNIEYTLMISGKSAYLTVYNNVSCKEYRTPIQLEE